MITALCVVAFGNIWLQTQWHFKVDRKPRAAAATNFASPVNSGLNTTKLHSNHFDLEGNSGEKLSDDMLLEEVLEEPLVTDLPIHKLSGGPAGESLKAASVRAAPWVCGRVLLTHEYVPYRNHHGADTRLLDILASLNTVGCEVKFLAYATLLGPSNTHGWEQPKASHISAVEALGASVDRQPCEETSSALLSSANLASVSKPLLNCLRRRLRAHQPRMVLCTLWFWTWPLRPHWASLVADAVATMDVVEDDDEHQGRMKKSDGLVRQRIGTTVHARCRLIVLSDDVHGDREATRPGATTEEGGRDERKENTVGSLRGSGKKEVASGQALLAASPERTMSVRAMELSVYQSADAVLAITGSDRSRMRVLLHEVPSSFADPVNEPLRGDSYSVATRSINGQDESSRVYLVPPTATLPHATAEAAWRGQAFQERNGFLFVGTGQVTDFILYAGHFRTRFKSNYALIFLYPRMCSLNQNPTNVAAVAWLLTEVWPLLRKHLRALGKTSTSGKRSGAAHLTIAGARPPGGSWHASIATLAQQQTLGVRVVGFVKDLEPLLSQARVVLSPVIKK